MKKESILFGIIGLLAGVIIAGFTTRYAVNNQQPRMLRMMDMHMPATTQQVSSHSEMSMSAMTEQLKSKTGDDFDKAFVEMMIAHHQGAIDMAELIPERAKHQEVKALGEAIILAQTKEIQDMQQWQKDWGYSTNEMNQMMHGGH